MFKILFEIITFPLSLFENPIYNYISMALIGTVAYLIAYRTVGEIGLRGDAGSAAHWIIRTVAFITIWFLLCIIIKVICFAMNHYICASIAVLLLFILIFLEKYSNEHRECYLNKKLF